MWLFNCWHADVIRFFVKSKCKKKKKQKMTKIIKIEEEKILSSERLDKFQWNVTYCILKVTKKRDFTLSLHSIFLEIYS